MRPDPVEVRRGPASHNLFLGGYCARPIENGRHWVLDAVYGEDAQKTADGHAGANLGLVRRVATSLLKQDPGKGSIKGKRLRAAWDGEYLTQVLQGFTAD